MASNIEVASYDPKKVNLVMNGKIITGFASDSMITIARNEDTVTTQVGVKGDVAYNENANESGTITVTLMGAHQWLYILASTLLIPHYPAVRSRPRPSRSASACHQSCVSIRRRAFQMRQSCRSS